jgi:hypothetical protein
MTIKMEEIYGRKSLKPLHIETKEGGSSMVDRDNYNVMVDLFYRSNLLLEIERNEVHGPAPLQVSAHETKQVAGRETMGARRRTLMYKA